MLKLVVAAAAATMLALPAQAVTVVQWDFENTEIASLNLVNSTMSPAVSASTGTGSAVGVHASGDTDWTTPVGNGSANALSSNTWAAGDYYQFSFSTVGYADMVVSFDQISSSTGPTSFAFAYSADGGSSFVTGTPYAILTTPSFSGSTYQPVHTYTVDLSSVSALDNQASVVLRVVSAVTPSNAGGTSRIDNFTVVMAPVPEPETAAMLAAGLALMGFVARRRRA